MTLSEILRYSTSSRARSSGRLTWHSRAPMDDLVLEGAVVAVASGGGNHFSSPLRDGKDSGISRSAFRGGMGTPRGSPAGRDLAFVEADWN
jgi:hypothetical protein